MLKKEYDKQYYQKNKEKLKAYSFEYRKNNPEKIKETSDKYRESSRELSLYASAKQRARKQKLDFSITVSDIVIPTHCPYLGIELTNTLHNGRIQTNSSLDRIDSSKGYTKENIQVISDLANKMKQNATEEQLILFAKGILKLHVKHN